MIKITAKIKNKPIKLINIYSKNLVEEIKKQGQKIKLENFKEGLILKPGKEIHVTIAANKRIQIAIGKLIKNKLIDPSIINKKSVPLYLDLNDWNLKEIFRKSVGLPITNESPKDLVIKNGAIRTNNQNQYFLDLSSKKLYELAKKESIRCLLNRKNEEITLVRSNDIGSRKLTSHGKRRVQISIPLEVLLETEVIKLKDESWLPIKIQLNLNSFGLTVLDFYNVKEERELVETLINKNIKINIKNYNDPYDIYLPEYKTIIELHNSIPGLQDLSTRHKVRPAMVRLRILEADYLVRNKIADISFVVLNKKWENGKYIQEIIKDINNKVIIVFTDYKENWSNNVGNKIISSVKSIQSVNY